MAATSKGASLYQQDNSISTVHCLSHTVNSLYTIPSNCRYRTYLLSICNLKDSMSIIANIVEIIRALTEDSVVEEQKCFSAALK